MIYYIIFRYKHCAFKLTLACTFKRLTVWFSSLSLGKLIILLVWGRVHTFLTPHFLHLGIVNDDQIAVRELRGRRVFRYPWEWALADGIYIKLPNTHIPHRQPR